MTNRRWLLVVCVTTAVAAGGGTAVLFAYGPAAPTAVTAQHTPSVRFTSVVRTDLAATLELDGALGYGVERPVKGGGGRATWLPSTGAVVSRGEPLFRVDDRPVTLFYGDTPLFRSLDATGLVGRDVRVVADNLKALGYDIGRQPAVGTVVTPPAPAAGASAGPAGSGAPTGPGAPVTVRQGDAVVTQTVVNAIKRWQRAAGLAQTGVVQAGDVVVLPQQVRVSAVTGHPADDATTPLVSVTLTTKVVTVQVQPVEADAVRAATTVTVSLPDGRSAAGKVAEVSRVAAAGNEERGGASSQPMMTATISLDDPNAVRSWDSAPVRVQFATQARNGVLAVPVGALLALREGGYAVQTDHGTLIPVTVGLFAKGMVEVTGAGIREGTRVVTTS